MNRLSREKSPYLLQHQHNPVDWWAWSDEAIAWAQRIDKPIFLSAGYSTCYWCHVMERECFEDKDVAKILNENFICIKLDREERPDIDAVYMEAVLAISGNGGWPLSVFLDTDLKPFFGGTYFPKDNFIQLLNKIIEAWTTQRESVKKAGAELYDVLQVTTRSTKTHELEQTLWQEAYSTMRQNFDPHYGGFGAAPKFPAPGPMRFLLRYAERFNEPYALEMVQKTLETMALGGLYDQVGGGFHRYSTDAQWEVPHFEKMLYDNALLIPAYLECYQRTGDVFCAETARASLEYLLREMRSERGGFFSAQDAGAVGQEGEFYVWQETELEDELNADEFNLVKELFTITSIGNFESGFCIVRLNEGVSWEQRFSPEAKTLVAKLLELRSKRRYPHLDDKVLTAWNGLAISAFCNGYRVLGSEGYLLAAQQAALFVREQLTDGEKLLRRYRDGESRFSGYLEDYAFFIQGLLDLYQCDFNPDWLRWAEKLQDVVDELFWDSAEGGYFAVSAEDGTVLVRKKEHSDSALPSASAVTALSLFRLHVLTRNEQYQKRAQDALAAYSGFFHKYPSAFCYSFLALEFEHFGALELVTNAESGSALAQAVKESVMQQFLPTLVISQNSDNYPENSRGKLPGAVYVCREGSCSAPLTEVSAVHAALRTHLH